MSSGLWGLISGHCATVITSYSIHYTKLYDKKLKPTKVIAGSLASIILAQSCAEAPLYYLDEDVVRINQELKSANINSSVVPIELVTNAEENNYLNFLNKLAKDIIEQPVVAKSFATNPAAFMERYGFPDMEINLDEGT